MGTSPNGVRESPPQGGLLLFRRDWCISFVALGIFRDSYVRASVEVALRSGVAPGSR